LEQGTGHSRSVAAIIPAFNEQDRIAQTVSAVAELPSVSGILVVDDGSQDRTADVARDAGAEVFELGRNRGKGPAMEHGVRYLWSQDHAMDDADLLLFLDADLQQTARAAQSLVDAVDAEHLDMCIATLPTQDAAGGGHGFVVDLARRGIRDATGSTMKQPLSGQRVISTRAFRGALPLAKGFGVEVGLTIDVLRAGFSVAERDVAFKHRVTGRDFNSQMHRANQFFWVWRALRQRGVGPALPIPRRGSG
jgi:glycosyltransferase involved in cell wall biosynthesis